MKKFLSFLCVFMMSLAPSLALAHPHFDKTIMAKLPGVTEATIIILVVTGLVAGLIAIVGACLRLALAPSE